MNLGILKENDLPKPAPSSYSRIPDIKFCWLKNKISKTKQNFKDIFKRKEIFPSLPDISQLNQPVKFSFEQNQTSKNKISYICNHLKLPSLPKLVLFQKENQEEEDPYFKISKLLSQGLGPTFQEELCRNWRNGNLWCMTKYKPVAKKVKPVNQPIPQALNPPLQRPPLSRNPYETPLTPHPPEF